MENKHAPEELTEWEQIQTPNSTLIIPQSNSDNTNQPENQLPVNTSHDNNQHLQEPRSNNLLPPPPANDAGVIRLYWKLLKSEILWIACTIKKYATHKVGLCTFSWALAGVSAVLLAFLLRLRARLQWRRRRLKLEDSRESLMLLIKEKDKRINQLLLQIAQMNEILLARRRVQVIRMKC